MWSENRMEQGDRVEKETILRRLRSRRVLAREAFNLTSIAKEDANQRFSSEDLPEMFGSLAAEAGRPQNITNEASRVEGGDWAVRYRLAMSNVFVEKAQYHLEARARNYGNLGAILYAIALLAFLTGASIAVYKFWKYDLSKSADQIFTKVTTVHAPTVPVSHTDSTQKDMKGIAANVTTGVREPPNSSNASGVDGTTTELVERPTWKELLLTFLLGLTAYGFIVITAVAFARGARACFDQKERLLAKRHSLRQGRLYLQLKGGNVTIEELDRAFNWNHEQLNAFTHMATDAQAPMGQLIQEIVKIVPDLVKTGVVAAKGR